MAASDSRGKQERMSSSGRLQSAGQEKGGRTFSKENLASRDDSEVRNTCSKQGELAYSLPLLLKGLK